MKNKSIEYYMQLPYKVEIIPDNLGNGFTAILPELPGCMTAAEKFSELDPLINDAKLLWLEVAIKHGDHIPEPAPPEEKTYSGKFLVRVPKSMHRQLSTRADIEETSLNQLIVSMLSESLGRLSADTRSRANYGNLNFKFSKKTKLSRIVNEGLVRNLFGSTNLFDKEEKFSWKQNSPTMLKITSG